MSEAKWIVQLFGDIYSTAWELSVVKEDNKHGRKSWGWFDESKLLISHNGGPCKWPLAKGLGSKFIAIAEELAEELNKELGIKDEPKQAE